MTIRHPPTQKGLYDPRREHDSCGVGFVADIHNRKSRQIVRWGLEILVNLDHRGAVGADNLAGDGAGILIQIPDRFLREECAGIGIELPEPGSYATGLVFLPRDESARVRCEASIADHVAREGQVLLGWRDVPRDGSCLGESVAPGEPVIRQVFIASGADCPDQDAFERKLYVIRKQAHHAIWKTELVGAGTQRFYFVSLSSRTLCYKAMVLAPRLEAYYCDLGDERLESALALVHQRFSTNTFPSWELAQPFRFLCHNGEINTLRGNINWMMARRERVPEPERTLEEALASHRRWAVGLGDLR